MTAYIPITEFETDPGAPGTSELWKKWRDNPIAIAEGSVGAPRIKGEALDNYYGQLTFSTSVIAAFVGLDRVRVVAAAMLARVSGSSNSSFPMTLQYSLSSDDGITWDGWVTIASVTAGASSTEWLSPTVVVPIPSSNAIRFRTDGAGIGAGSGTVSLFALQGGE